MEEKKDDRRGKVELVHTNFEIDEFKSLIYQFLALCDYLLKQNCKIQILSFQYIDLKMQKKTSIMAHWHFWLQVYIICIIVTNLKI